MNPFLFRSLCLILLIPFLSPDRVEGKTIHVSPQRLEEIPQEDQVHTVSAAVDRAEAGDTVLIHGGIYREQVVLKKSGTQENPILLRAVPGASVVVTGADAITDWKREDQAQNVFSASWPHEFVTWNKNRTHPDDEYHRLIGRCEQVFVNRYPLRQVLDRQQLSRGTFYADLEADRLYLWTADNTDVLKGDTIVEASVRSQVLICEGDFVRINGIRFRYAANRAQEGAVALAGNHITVENCVFESTNSIGAQFTGEDCTVRNCRFQFNGQLGFGANHAHRLLFSHNVVSYNNLKGFDRGWEAGGDKIAMTRDAVLEDSTFLENRGCGIWFDIGNENGTVRNCLIAQNENAGIFYEISYGLHAHDNVIVANGLESTAGSWGASGGICLSSSPDCVIERNLLMGNKEGFNFREQYRTTPRIDNRDEIPVWNHNEIIRNNIMAYNRDAQVGGWFDIDDQRHWPPALQETKPEDGKAQFDVAAPYKSTTISDSLRNLSLNELHLTFQNNFYAVHPGQDLFNWGTAWKKNKHYSNPTQVQEELALEQGSQAGEFNVRDFFALDLRIPAETAEIVTDAYPRGNVPGVTLGIEPAE